MDTLVLGTVVCTTMSWSDEQDFGSSSLALCVEPHYICGKACLFCSVTMAAADWFGSYTLPILDLSTRQVVPTIRSPNLACFVLNLDEFLDLCL